MYYSTKFEINATRARVRIALSVLRGLADDGSREVEITESYTNRDPRVWQVVFRVALRSGSPRQFLIFLWHPSNVALQVSFLLSGNQRPAGAVRLGGPFHEATSNY